MNSDKFTQDLEIRKQVLGKSYVHQTLQQIDGFTMPLQLLVTEYCWGTIRENKTLLRQQRSLIHLAMIAVLNRLRELNLYGKGAVGNSLHQDQIRKVLLYVAIYCGIPTAVDRFRIANQLLQNMNLNK